VRHGRPSLTLRSPRRPRTLSLLLRVACAEKRGSRSLRDDLDRQGLGPCKELRIPNAEGVQMQLPQVKRHFVLLLLRELLPIKDRGQPRSEEHTSELQSLRHLVCRLLL